MNPTKEGMGEWQGGGNNVGLLKVEGIKTFYETCVLYHSYLLHREFHNKRSRKKASCYNVKLAVYCTGCPKKTIYKTL